MTVISENSCNGKDVPPQRGVRKGSATAGAGEDIPAPRRRSRGGSGEPFSNQHFGPVLAKYWERRDKSHRDWATCCQALSCCC